jgi:DNA-directed RNA polymerase alpha subunit
MNKKISFLPLIEVKKVDQSSQTTEFIFDHLALGLAATLGNTFRRLLLTQVFG